MSAQLFEPFTLSSSIMAHITLHDGLPGIIGPLAFRPETAKPLMLLAETLLRGPSTMSEGERELIAAHVSRRNTCVFCATSHAAAARHLLNDPEVVDAVLLDPESAGVSPKMRALLNIAGKVAMGGLNVTDDDIARARAEEATDIEIHDTVLIASAFCMFNRYVDGLATWTPDDPAMYDMMGQRLASVGYLGERESRG
jgi:uncharacterized peroxidase-related enzyme